jgi:hypothetical protein
MGLRSVIFECSCGVNLAQLDRPYLHCVNCHRTFPTNRHKPALHCINCGESIESTWQPESSYLHFMDDAERDRRSAGQWLRSVRAYLEFTAGTAWRRSSDRSNPEYRCCVDAIRALNGLDLAASPPPSRIAITLQTAEAIHVAALAARPRAELVEELMNLNQALTDRRILLHLQSHKLASMLLDARQGAEKFAPGVEAGQPLEAIA